VLTHVVETVAKTTGPAKLVLTLPMRGGEGREGRRREGEEKRGRREGQGREKNANPN
jgi:hypothetical protein